jgi:membrane dipeptidase
MSNDYLVIDGCTPKIGSDGFLQQIIDANVSAVCVTVSAQIGAHMPDGLFQSIEEMNVYYNLAELRPDKCLIARQTSDIVSAKRDGKLALILALQNGRPFEADPVNLLPMLYRNGVRLAQLTYNESNRLGDGCFEVDDRGLTTIGRQAVREMDRLGIVIDLSHVGQTTGRDVIEYSTKPCVFTHTGCSAITECVRNKSDDLMKLMADAGGVVGLSPYSPFCQPVPGQRPSLDDYLQHVDHALSLVGDDHVAIGTDIAEHWAVRWFSNSGRRMPDLVEGYTWDTIYAQGFDSLACFPSVFDEMKNRGYTDETLRKIAGGNWMRVFSEVWKTDE